MRMYNCVEEQLLMYEAQMMCVEEKYVQTSDFKEKEELSFEIFETKEMLAPASPPEYGKMCLLIKNICKTLGESYPVSDFSEGKTLDKLWEKSGGE